MVNLWAARQIFFETSEMGANATGILPEGSRMVLVSENTLKRLRQRQQILTPPVTQTLKNLDSEMGNIL